MRPWTRASGWVGALAVSVLALACGADGHACSDGETEACYEGPPGTEGLGSCKAGIRVCAGGALGPCQAQVLPATESCASAAPPGAKPGDGLDESCDGQVDEGCACSAGATQPCYPGDPLALGVGACAAGVQTCTAEGTWGACEGAILPAPELCETALDDDCDGVANEPAAGCLCIPGEVVPCYEGAVGTQGIGACAAGGALCQADGLTLGACTGQVLPAPEDCQTAEDDDCDGDASDAAAGCCAEGGPPVACYTGPMETQDVGLCKQGLTSCSGTAWGPCEGEVLPAAEDCESGPNESCVVESCAEAIWTLSADGTVVVDYDATPEGGLVVVMAGQPLVLDGVAYPDPVLAKVSPTGAVDWVGDAPNVSRVGVFSSGAILTTKYFPGGLDFRAPDGALVFQRDILLDFPRVASDKFDRVFVAGTASAPPEPDLPLLYPVPGGGYPHGFVMRFGPDGTREAVRQLAGVEFPVGNWMVPVRVEGLAVGCDRVYVRVLVNGPFVDVGAPDLIPIVKSRLLVAFDSDLGYLWHQHADGQVVVDDACGVYHLHGGPAAIIDKLDHQGNVAWTTDPVNMTDINFWDLGAWGWQAQRHLLLAGDDELVLFGTADENAGLLAQPDGPDSNTIQGFAVRFHRATGAFLGRKRWPGYVELTGGALRADGSSLLLARAGQTGIDFGTGPQQGLVFARTTPFSANPFIVKP